MMGLVVYLITAIVTGDGHICSKRSHVDELVEEEKVYSAHLTHNLIKMADEAGLYYVLWRPEELCYETADQLIPDLSKGLDNLRRNPEKYEKYNPENGWVSYACLYKFTSDYLEACRKFPEANVYAER